MRYLVTAVAVVLALVGCGGSEDAGAPAADAPSPSTAKATGTGEYSCPPHGGACLGPLAPGTFTTTVFSPAIDYSVPEGWTNGEDLPGNFLLQLDGDPRYLGVYRNAAAPASDCQERPDGSVGRSVEALAAWLTAHPGLKVTQPEPVSVGGLDGVWLDISLASSWTATCPFSGGKPVLPILIGGGPSSLHHVLLPGFQERLYLLTYEQDNIVIEVGPEGGSLPEYLEEVGPVIESFDFTP